MQSTIRIRESEFERASAKIKVGMQSREGKYYAAWKDKK